ncbi:hypothetical protein GCM10025865_11470 [Paraoerskovia sediminicola]|uniref:AI-2E family transporter n=1 Tax=Paraoerskovia sediminicola TaxID=1138587 RepID=A0ABN6XAB4_9CELL|nr:AI-2E family transporter [Paraoerskovia sediminicola]BDZ41848.1 hypothetical protein GCM10025865_11470 [Paraoerskovia sediminicola]
MTDAPPAPRPAASGVRRTGATAWALVGIALAATITWAALGAVSGLVVPLVLAAVIGILLHPVVEALARRRVPRGVGASAVLVGLIGVLVLAVWVTIVGVADQGADIAAKLSSGLLTLEDQLAGTDLSDLDLGGSVSGMVGGLAGFFGSAFSSAAAFVAGSFVATFFLYFMLVDWARIEAWLGSKLQVGSTPGPRSSTSPRRRSAATSGPSRRRAS